MAMLISSSDLHARFAFLNANHSKTASIFLNQDILSSNFDLILLNEPFYNYFGIPFFDKSYKILAHHNKPRTATIIINKTYNFTAIEVNRDMIILNLELNNEKILIINVYVPLSSTLDDSLSTLEYYIEKYKKNKIIIMGDLNSKHSVWGDKKTGTRGYQLMEFILKTDLNILNNPGSPPTFQSIIGRSWIDVVLYKNINDNKIGKFEVNQDIYMSDHSLISFSLFCSKRKYTPNKMNMKNINYWKFSIDLLNLLNSKKLELGNLNIENYLEDTRKKITQIYDKNKIKGKKDYSICMMGYKFVYGTKEGSSYEKVISE